MSQSSPPLSRSLPKEHLEDFDQHAWCRAIMNDPTVTKTMVRQLPPPFNTSVSNSLFTKTLFTDDALRAFLALFRPRKENPEESEGLLLISLGKDVDGGLRRLHGGVIATLLDQVMGILITYLHETTSATAEMNIKFKDKIETPCVVLCRSRVTKHVGRWIELAATVEDGHGKVYAEGWGHFVKPKQEENYKL